VTLLHYPQMKEKRLILLMCSNIFSTGVGNSQESALDSFLIDKITHTTVKGRRTIIVVRRH
jgi:hypothetical protein